ncbi:MAG: V-type ATP synthase subunit F [Candidatus Methanomethylophilaceae archaeon]|nr:V-type ATP synthase subunit F [Thermoplasmata archaeon]MBQ2762129.1 V-type ATP synthase subunit F [Candidatus Methanomethylophilaceae archaeon]
MDIAVIGSDEFVLGFRLAGLRRVFVATPENYQEVLLKAMEEPDIGVLAADGKDLDLLTPNVRTKVMDSIQPVVVPVGRGETDLREKVKRAIGIDLYKEDE